MRIYDLQCVAIQPDDPPSFFDLCIKLLAVLPPPPPLTQDRQEMTSGRMRGDKKQISAEIFIQKYATC